MAGYHEPPGRVFWEEFCLTWFSLAVFLSHCRCFLPLFFSPQIKGGAYPSFGDFDRDLKLMWKNCRTYNLEVCDKQSHVFSVELDVMCYFFRTRATASSGTMMEAVG